MGCLLSTSFVSISTPNPTLICAKPVAACDSLPFLPLAIFHVAIQKVPLPSGKEGVDLLGYGWKSKVVKVLEKEEGR